MHKEYRVGGRRRLLMWWGRTLNDSGGTGSMRKKKGRAVGRTMTKGRNGGTKGGGGGRLCWRSGGYSRLNIREWGKGR